MIITPLITVTCRAFGGFLTAVHKEFSAQNSKCNATSQRVAGTGIWRKSLGKLQSIVPRNATTCRAHVAVVFDEVNFNLCGSFNRYNFRYWAEIMELRANSSTLIVLTQLTNFDWARIGCYSIWNFLPSDGKHLWTHSLAYRQIYLFMYYTKSIVLN